MSAERVRAAALVAALVLAALSRGDVLVLAAFLALGSWRPVPAVAVIAALVAAGWRWSSTALEHLASAQAVLGPAGLVDPPAHAAAAWCGAAALVLAIPPRSGWPGRLAAASAAAVVVAGPGPDDAWVRVLATGIGLVVAYGLHRSPLPRAVREGLAAMAGAGALIAVATDAPGLDGVVDTGALGEGLAVGAAVVVLSWAVATALGHVHDSRTTRADGRFVGARR